MKGGVILSKDLVNSVDDDLLDMLKDDSYEEKLEEHLDSIEDDEVKNDETESGEVEESNHNNKSESTNEKKGKININLITSGRETSEFSFNDEENDEKNDEVIEDDDETNEEYKLVNKTIIDDKSTTEDINDKPESVLLKDELEKTVIDDVIEIETDEEDVVLLEESMEDVEELDIHEGLSDELNDEMVIEKDSSLKSKIKEHAHLVVLFIVAAIFGSLITMVLLNDRSDGKTPFVKSEDTNEHTSKNESIVKSPIIQESEEERIIVGNNSLSSSDIKDNVDELVTPDIQLSAKEAIIQAVQIVNYYESQMSNYTQDEIMTINKYIRGDTSRILIKNKLSANISRKNQVLVDFQEFESFFTYVGLTHLYQNTDERLEAHLFFEEKLLNNAFSKGELKSEVDRIISNDEKYSTKQMEIIESLLIHNDLNYEKRSGEIIIK